MQGVFNQIQNSIQKGCLILIPLFMVIKIALIIIKGFISDHPINYHPFYSGIFLWLLISTYPVVVQKISDLSNYIIGIVSAPVDDPIKAISESMNEARVLREANVHKNLNQSAEKLKSGNIFKGLSDLSNAAWGAMIEGVKESGQGFLASLVSIFASISRMFIESVRSFLLKFLILIGPLALTFSLNEGFGHIGKFWLQKLFSVYCWSLTLNILDHIIIDYYHQVAVVPQLNTLIGSPNSVSETPYYVDQLIVGFMYTLVPWLTSLYLGGFNSSHFLTTTFRTFTSLVSTAISSTQALIHKK